MRCDFSAGAIRLERFCHMDFFTQLWTNKLLISGLSAWACAQIVKAAISMAMNKKFELSRLLGDGGMPSGHSATVTALAAASGIAYGFSSFQFAITTVLAVIVMHDAMGVRRETGKQAVLLNKMTDLLNTMANEEISPDEKLKEFVGHTPMQVVVGAVIGLLVAVIFS